MISSAIDVVIPAYNEERHIGRCLEAVAAQDYPPEQVRIWVVDAGSADRTAAIVRDWQRLHPRIKLMSAGKRLSTPEALNDGISHGSAELVARVDAHGWPEPDFLRQAAEVMGSQGPDVAAVGGRAQPDGATPFGRAFALAWTSRFGVGGSVYASRREREEVDTVPWGMYRRSAWEQAGGFDTRMVHSEDEELNWRLRKAGYRILLDSAVRFHYVPRDSWAAAFRQYRSYGRARVRVVRAHPDFLRIHHLAPAALVAVLGALAVSAPASARAREALFALLTAYCSASLAAAVAACRKSDVGLVPLVASAFWSLHLGYGAGMLSGGLELARPARLRVPIRACGV